MKDYFIHGRLFVSCSSQVSCFPKFIALLELFFFRGKERRRTIELHTFLTNKISSHFFSSRFHACTWAVILFTGVHSILFPNYEMQAGAMTESMSIPLFSISLPANFLLPQNLMQIFSSRWPGLSLSSSPPAPTERRKEQYLPRLICN